MGGGVLIFKSNKVHKFIIKSAPHGSGGLIKAS